MSGSRYVFQEAGNTQWKLFTVNPISSEPHSITSGQPKIAAASITLDFIRMELIEAFSDPTCGNNGVVIGEEVMGPKDHAVSFNGEDFRTCQPLFPEILKVKSMHLWHFFLTSSRSKNSEAGFRSDATGAGANAFTSTIQVVGEQTFLFYTASNFKLAVNEYKVFTNSIVGEQEGRWLPKSAPPKFPIHHSLHVLDTEPALLMDEIPNWYKTVLSNQNGKFPDSLMPLEVTVTVGQILVFDKTMVYARLNSEYRKRSLALFAS